MEFARIKDWFATGNQIINKIHLIRFRLLIHLISKTDILRLLIILLGIDNK
jgi:hypothetical protein